MADNSTVTSAAMQKAGAGGGVIPFNPPDKMILYQSYMPFVKGGGLYVPTPKKYDIGNEVFLLIKMPGEGNDRMPAVGKVVWVNRNGSAQRPGGIGVQLSDTPENLSLRDRIEVLIAGISTDTPTFTM